MKAARTPLLRAAALRPTTRQAPPRLSPTQTRLAGSSKVPTPPGTAPGSHPQGQVGGKGAGTEFNKDGSSNKNLLYVQPPTFLPC